jgi:hypothetical protein
VNPNEYNDDAFLEASMQLQEQGANALLALWDAGARPEDIVSEINNVLENMEIPLQVVAA